MEKQYLDYILVPSGILLMVAYHTWLLHRVVKHPTTTAIGINAIGRRIWVQTMMEDPAKNGILAVQTLRNNLMASTLMASTAIMLSSIITVLMKTNTAGSGRGDTPIVYGDTTNLVLSIKFFSILLCFLVAFLSNVQSIRYYSHAGILINVPMKKLGPSRPSHLTVDYVGRSLNRGSYFWSLGLRAFYFSFPLLLWVFGPIPMFACCLVLVFLLYFLDVSSDWGVECGGGGVEGKDSTHAEVV